MSAASASIVGIDRSAPVRRIAGFMHMLRDNGFRVGLGETHDASLIVASAAGPSPRRLRESLKALCCSTYSDWDRFDNLFDSYFLGRGVKRVVRMTGASQDNRKCVRRLGESGSPERGSQPDRVESDEGQSAGNPADGRGRRMCASQAEATQVKDLRRIVDPEEVALANALAQRLARSMRARLARRERARTKGRRLDLRRIIHSSISKGGEPFDLVWRRRKPKPLRLVILLDASGSMELYAPFFIRFMHGVIDAFREAEAFVFHTRLVHIAAALRDRNVTRAVERLSLMAQGIGGGTRIGESLADFNTWHARRVIHSRTCVMIMSDGFDTGAPGVLACEMRRLRMRCKRIVWLNPMIGWRDYEPSARGMREALPYVDLFAPAHNLESLAALEPYLARI